MLQRRTLERGTTTACYFATIHLEASKELCRVVGELHNNCSSHEVNTVGQGLKSIDCELHGFPTFAFRFNKCVCVL